VITEPQVVPNDYKQTDLGVVPNDWDVCTIQALLDQGSILGHLDGNHGELYPRSHEFKESGVPYITANDLRGYRVCFDNCKYLSEERARRFRKGVAKNGDVLFAHNATVGPTALLSTELPYVILSTTATYFRCNPVKLIGTFLLYALQSSLFVTQYRAIMAQSTRNQVPITAQRKLSIVVPPTIAEQEAIADALGNADDLIESLELFLVKKRLIKQGAMQELLTGKKRLPGFNGEWETKPIRQIAPLQRGFDLPTRRLQEGPYPVVYSNGVLNSHAEFQVKGPGVITGRSGTIGKVTYVEKDYWPHNTALWVTSFNGNNPKFIFYLYSHIGFERFATGSGVPTLNRNDVHAFNATIPTPSEQSVIALVLSDMDTEITALETKLAKARQVKQGMMQELLTGRIRLV
jgi:type I restriction enzyme S subunit